MKAQPKIGQLKFEFLSQDEAELPCDQNEKIVILEDSGDGWSYCHRMNDPNAQGYVPTQYIIVLDNEKPPEDIIYEDETVKVVIEPPKEVSGGGNGNGTLNIPKKENVQDELFLSWGDDDTLRKSVKIQRERAKTPEPTRPTNTNNTEHSYNFRSPTVSNVRNNPAKKKQTIGSGNVGKNTTTTPTSIKRIGSNSNSSIPVGSLKQEKPVDHIPKHNPSKPIYQKKNSKKIGDLLKKYIIFSKYRRFYSLSKKFKKQRNRLLQILETISTEENYLRQLTFCLEHVKKPLLEQKIITQQQSKTLFSNMKEIQGLNNMLLADLQKQRQLLPNIRIASCFSKISPFFRMYHVYVNNFETSNELLDTLKRKDSRVVKFDEQITKVEGSDQLSIKDFFLVPIMRIPRYKLLLGHVLKYTEEDHNEYIELKKALDVVSEVANEVNEMKRWKHQTGVAVEISKVLKGRYDSLIQRYRRYVNQVKVKVKCKEKGVNRFMSFTCYLFSDLIIFLEHDSFMKMRSPRAAIIFLVCTKITKSKKDIITLRTITGSKLVNYIVQFSSSAEREKWLSLFNSSIQEKFKAIQSKLTEEENLILIEGGKSSSGGKKNKKKNTKDVINPVFLQKLSQDRSKMIEKEKIPRKEYQEQKKVFNNVETEYTKVTKKLKDNQERLKFVGEKIGKLMKRINEIDVILNKDKQNIQGEMKSKIMEHQVIRQDKEFFHVIGNEDNKFDEIFDTKPLFKFLE